MTPCLKQGVRMTPCLKLLIFICGARQIYPSSGKLESVLLRMFQNDCILLISKIHLCGKVAGRCVR